jgi:hypothetical protein
MKHQRRHRVTGGELFHAQGGRLHARVAATLFCALCSSVTFAQPASASDGLAHWQAVYSVLTNPRCINCHTMTNYPRQDDDRHPHKFGVVRGRHDKGVPAAMCSTCHQAANNSASGVPGGPAWHLAPLSMAWESKPGVPMSSGQLCATLKDRKRNGDHTLAELAEHHETEPLVQWAWTPGTHADGSARAAPPLTHGQFVTAFSAWIKAGAPCPPAVEARNAK